MLLKLQRLVTTHSTGIFCKTSITQLNVVLLVLHHDQ